MLLRSIHLLLIFVTLSIAGLPGFTITSPTNDQPFCDNTTITVTWKAPAKRPVYVEYSFNNGTSWTLIQKKPFFTGANGVGSTTISIPEGLATDNGKVRLSKALSIPIFVDDIPIFSWKKSDKEWLVHSFAVRNLESSMTVSSWLPNYDFKLFPFIKLLTSDYKKIQCDVLTPRQLGQISHMFADEFKRAESFNRLQVGDIITLDSSITHNIIPQYRRITSILYPDEQGKRTFTTIPLTYLEAAGRGARVVHSKTITANDIQSIRTYPEAAPYIVERATRTANEGFCIDITLNDIPLSNLDNNVFTTDNEITLSGTLTVDPSKILIERSINENGDEYQKNGIRIDFKSDTEVKFVSLGNKEIPKEKCKKRIKEVLLTPYYVQLGPIPILVTPSFDVSLAGACKLDAQVRMKASIEASIEAGYETTNGDISIFVDPALNKLEFDKLPLSVTGEVRAYTPLIEAKIAINKIFVPQIEFSHYFAASGDPFGNPFYRVWRGIDGQCALQLSEKIPSFIKDKVKDKEISFKLFDFQKTMKTAAPKGLIATHVPNSPNATITWIDYENGDGYKIDNLATMASLDALKETSLNTASVPIVYGKLNKFNFQMLDKYDGVSDVTQVSVTPTSSPVIAPASIPNGRVGIIYKTQFTATDLDGDAISRYSLSGAPAGMSIGTATGLLTWNKPTIPGTYSFTVKAYDTKGTEGSRNYNLIITPNHAPIITTLIHTSGGEVYKGKRNTWQLNSTDIDGDVRTYSAKSVPDGMSVEPNGVVTWTPNIVNQKVAATFRVSDGSLTNEKTFTINVGNQSPQITTSFLETAITGHKYNQTVSASDGDGDYVLIGLSSNSKLPTGLTYRNGILSGTISKYASEDTYALTFTANDGRGTMSSTSEKTLYLDLRKNSVPTIEGKEMGVTTRSNLSEAISWYDGDNDNVTFKIISGAPIGFKIDDYGYMIWNSSQKKTGKYNITIEVNDGCGGVNRALFTLFCAPELYSAKVMLFDNLYKDGQGGYDKIKLYVSRFGVTTEEGVIELEEGPSYLNDLNYSNFLWWGHKEFEFKYLHNGDRIFIKGVSSATEDNDDGDITVGGLIDIVEMGYSHNSFPSDANTVLNYPNGIQLRPGDTRTIKSFNIINQ